MDSEEGNNLVPIETDVVTIESKYGGAKHSFIVDTGAEMSLISSRKYINRNR